MHDRKISNLVSTVVAGIGCTKINYYTLLILFFKYFFFEFFKLIFIDVIFLIMFFFLDFKRI